MENKKYVKLLNKEDVVKILEAGNIALLPDSQNFNGETIPSIQKSKNIMLCRAKTNKENTNLELIMKYMSTFMRNPQYNSPYSSKEILVFIDSFTCQIADYGDEYIEENTNMTLKLKEILSQKDKNYLKDFEEYWNSVDNDKNDENE